MSDTRRPRILQKTDRGSASKLRKSERTREAILDGALEFLWSRPFREMTVAELMSITGTCRSAFYQYFDDLHGLMETLLHGIEKDIFEATVSWFRGDLEIDIAIRAALVGF